MCVKKIQDSKKHTLFLQMQFLSKLLFCNLKTKGVTTQTLVIIFISCCGKYFSNPSELVET
jgi:hypothetical protein